MPTKLLAKPIIDQLEPSLRSQINKLKKRGVTPRFVDYWVGDDRPSAIFLDAKHKKASQLGIEMTIRAYPSSVTAAEVTAQLQQDAQDPAVHGIMVQLPLPPHINTEKLLAGIPTVKDVDGLRGNSFPAPVAKAVMQLLRDRDLSHKHLVVIGHGQIAGQPVIDLLQSVGHKPTIIGLNTQHPAETAHQADILICATNQEGGITKAWVKPGAVIIDIGRNLAPGAEAEASAYTPPTGAIGPLTVHFLMANVMSATEAQSTDK